MLDHHIQKQILFRLAFEESLTFSELKPDDLDNKLFTYHLHKVVGAGFVEKNEDGHYRLTAKGRRVGKGALQKDDRFIDRAYSLLILVVRNQQGEWLLFKRASQPLLGYTGFMQAKPQNGIPVIVAAQQALKENANLEGDFSVAGQAFLTMNSEGKMESYIHATVLTCTNAHGNLQTQDPHGEYSFYASLPTTNDEVRLIPSVPLLADIAEGRSLFAEASFDL